ncbi:substrate of the Dot/Icm secretion system [Legionella gratiana]|uniref:Dot/Icm secretion system substrate n=1 Tax=Legionella gratiana TaxID=45066 RepID=A0A378JDU8_9GAMM|nr:hypothetical protein [Legionella gratiana]KTD08992.1 substrate of the Dot/Icm secretion system [Legionella gratiana]STX45795.1 Dot/Icm secretion system substrate [Legionella gratiana]
MTFELKELSTLKKEFNDAVDVLLKRDKKGKIEDLANPRKYELQYLSSILNRLEEQVTEKTMKPQIAAITFYGAMQTVMRDIENKRGMFDSSGLLSDSLANIIGINAEISAENKPDLYQTAKFYTAINEFLKQIFVNNDSRKGFKKDHILRAIPTNHLNELVETSYLLSKTAEKAIVDSLVANGQTTVVLEKPTADVEEKQDIPVVVEGKKNIWVGEYVANKKVSSPLSATGRFGTWDELNLALADLIKDELADKNVSKINKLGLHRAAQLHFLNTIKGAVQATEISESEKIAVLAGAMHLVRKQIDDEYASAVLTSTENSVIHKGLNKILGKKGDVASQDIEALIFSTTQFMRFLTVEPKANDKKAIRAKHFFSEIAGFDLKNIFNLCIDMIHDCRNDALHHVVEEFKKEGKTPEKAPKSYIASALSKLSFLTSKKEESSEEEDDELEHKSTDALTH